MKKTVLQFFKAFIKIISHCIITRKRAIWILSTYLKYHDFLHRMIIARCGAKVFNGLHPKNVLNFRSEYFIEQVRPQDVILDVACGTGLILKRVSPIIRYGIGIDYSEKNIALCKTIHAAENIEYIHEDIHTFDYIDLKKRTGYNTAIFSHILEHIKDVQSILQRVDANRLIICVPSQENWYTQLLIFFGLPYFKDATHYREYTRDMLRKEINSSGYDILSIGFNSEGEIVAVAEKKP